MKSTIITQQLHHMNISRLKIILGLIAFGILSRFIPHPPNFTSINAISLTSVLILGNPIHSFVVLFTTLFLSDLILGLHSTLIFTYLAFSTTLLTAYGLKKHFSLHRLPMISLSASILFFLIANFGVWLTTPLYPKTIAGLGICYIEALPFHSYLLLGDFVYTTFICSILSGYHFLSMRNQEI